MSETRQQVILAFAAKKQGGKNTSYSCIRLWRPEAQDFSFAESLKRMAVDILGLEEWQAFGTDEQKNTAVPHILWDNFPLPAYNREDGTIFVGHPDGMTVKYPTNVGMATIPIPSFPDVGMQSIEIQFSPTPTYDPDVARHSGEFLRRKRGPMTAREVLQYWGTEIFRRQYTQVWADACIRKIHKSGCPLAVITDCRFPNEVEAVQKAGGKVVKLTKVMFPDDKHPSEIALDAENYDQEKFDAVLDNSKMNVQEQCEALYVLLRRWGYVKHKEMRRIHV